MKSYAVIASFPLTYQMQGISINKWAVSNNTVLVDYPSIFAKKLIYSATFIIRYLYDSVTTIHIYFNIQTVYEYFHWIYQSVPDTVMFPSWIWIQCNV